MRESEGRARQRGPSGVPGDDDCQSYFLVSGPSSLPLEPGTHVIGRTTDADISFADDPQLSRQHARVDVSSDGVDVEDLGSSNGTWVDGRLVRGRVRLRLGATLRVGSQSLMLRCSPASEARAPIPSVEAPSVRFLSIPSGLAIDGPTQPGDPFALVHDDAIRALDEKRIDDARQLVEPILELVDVWKGPPRPSVLERATVLALRLALATGNEHYANWVLQACLQAGALLEEPAAELLEQAASEVLNLDFEVLGQYLSMLRRRAPELGEARVELLCSRIENATARRVSTIPAPPPSRA